MEANNNKNKRPSESRSTLLRLTDLFFRMGAVIAVGTFIGRWIDNRLSMTRPVFTLILCLLGVGYAIYIVYRDTSPPKQ